MKRPVVGSRNSLLVSIAVHVVVIAALASITFRYDLGDLLGLSHEKPVAPERLHYLVLPRGPIGNGSNPTAAQPKTTPAPLRAPTTMPTTIPEPAPPTQTSGAVSGKAGGTGGAPAGVATGVEPAAPDPRIALEPGHFWPVPKTPAERVDSAVKSIFQVYADSVAVADANRGRAPGDWTIDRNGQKWGWDPQGIHLGKFTLPNAILAALPLKVGANGDALIDGRSRAGIRSDILTHSQGLSEDDFRAAVRRIRERKERERKEQKDQKDKDKTIAGAGSTP
jgi:hypothetical protein